MVAILDHCQHHVISRQPVRQRQRVPPWHVGILSALQDANRTSHLDVTAEQQMVAALLDQSARNRIGRAILRRPQPDAAGFYSTEPLRRLLGDLVDFDRINGHDVRLTVGAANVSDGTMHYFDSRDMPAPASGRGKSSEKKSARRRVGRRRDIARLQPQGRHFRRRGG